MSMTNSSIILLNPGGSPELEALEKDRHSGIYMYPYSLLFLQNYLVLNNIESEIIDLYWQKEDELFNAIKQVERPIIGITAQSHSILKAIGLVQQIKKINQNSFIIVGGNFFTHTHIDVLNRFENIDVVVRGEGEITLLKLVTAIHNNESFGSIDGITYRLNGTLQVNNDRKTEMDIEQFALQYDKLPLIERFSEGILMRNYEKENYRSFPVFLGRGCSRRCSYCEYNLFKYRVRKIPDILKEIDYLIETYGAEYFTFADPSFCERKKFVKEFCEILIEKYPNIKWSCEARVDTPTEILELMAKAGCISVDFGLESGSEKVLKAIKKDIDLNKTLEYAKTCKRLNIRSHMFLMVSLPDEQKEDALQTYKVCKELSPYVTSISLGVTQILPGTALEQVAFEKGILPKNFSYYDKSYYHSYTQFCDSNVPLYLEHLDIDFIEEFFIKIMDLKAQQYDNLNSILRKAKTGILSLHKRSFRKNLIYIRRFVLALINKVFK